MTTLPKVACELSNLRVHYPIRSGLLRRVVGHVKAVDGVDLTIYRGETIAVVGESGCGKSSLARALLELEPAASGDVRVHSREGDRPPVVRAVFQDPHASLDPRWTVGRSIREGMRVQKVDRRDRAIDLLERVGLDVRTVSRYPHQLSGGQQQRVAIARALAGDPDLIVLDEPTSALDVSIQAQILNLLKDLQSDLELTYLFISHDLATVGQIADRVVVMYLGQVMEMGSQVDSLQHAVHPYTQSLLQSVLTTDRGSQALSEQKIRGDVPSPRNPPSGCRFRTRCPYAQQECAAISYSLQNWTPDHAYARCVHVDSHDAATVVV